MEIRFTLGQVAHVPVYFWPWVWWQLFWLRGWAEAVDRELIYEIAADGRVHVVALSDDKRDLRAWMSRQRKLYREHWTPMHDASGEAHLSAVHYWMGRFMACGRRLIWRWVRVVFRAAPPFKDSS